MSFEQPTPKAEQLDPHECVGMRVIGLKDPREMTSAEFYESPDCLYHGSASEFNYDHFLNYRDSDTIQRILSDGSMTLGSGLYTTHDRSEAENYSVVRGGDARKEQPHLSTFVPYKARILDLREKTDLSKNGNVPKALLQAWTAYMRSIYAERKSIFDKKEQPSFGDEMDIEWFEEYIERLSLMERLGKTYDLRTVLATGDSGEGKKDLPPMSAGAPPWVGMWMTFMLQKGIDGIMCYEGGEGNGEGGLNTVFYNLNTIGTYASWHSQRGHGVI